MRTLLILLLLTSPCFAANEEPLRSPNARFPSLIVTNQDGTETRRLQSITRHGRTSIYTVGGFSDVITVHLDTGSVDTQTAFMLIDISDTTLWKHTKTDHIILDNILLQADPDGPYLGEIKLGYLKNVDATDGDFVQIINLNMAKQSDIIIEEIELGTHGFHLQDSTHFGVIIADSTLFQTDVNLAGPDDPSELDHPSGNGDLVMIVERAAGAVDVSITLVYETVGAE